MIFTVWFIYRGELESVQISARDRAAAVRKCKIQFNAKKVVQAEPSSF
jgi:hypothetical protein